MRLLSSAPVLATRYRFGNLRHINDDASAAERLPPTSANEK
jgi:hypothetical protein